MAKIEGMALNMVLALAKAELMDACRTRRGGAYTDGCSTY